MHLTPPPPLPGGLGCCPFRDFLFIVTFILGVCNCSMVCCMLLQVHSSIAIILMGKRELVALLNLSYWCLVMVEWLLLTVPWCCLRFVIVVFPDHTHVLFLLVPNLRPRFWLLLKHKDVKLEWRIPNYCNVSS